MSRVSLLEGVYMGAKEMDGWAVTEIVSVLQ
jgi:hypothetical protein